MINYNYYNDVLKHLNNCVDINTLKNILQNLYNIELEHNNYQTTYQRKCDLDIQYVAWIKELRKFENEKAFDVALDKATDGKLSEVQKMLLSEIGKIFYN